MPSSMLYSMIYETPHEAFGDVSAIHHCPFTHQMERTSVLEHLKSVYRHEIEYIIFHLTQIKLGVAYKNWRCTT
jgi:hypothetical protein